MMRLVALMLILSISILSTQAQYKFPAIDKSPMDMCYYPVNYPVLRVQNKITEPLLARIVYSRPQKNGRQVFGELVEYGQVWRLGANEATEIELYSDCKVNGQKLKKGRYTLYAIPYEDKWTVIFNKETNIWGAFLYDEKKDVLRTDIKTELQAEATEAFSMGFEKAGDSSINLVMAWDRVKAVLPFTF